MLHYKRIYLKENDSNYVQCNIMQLLLLLKIHHNLYDFFEKMRIIFETMYN